MYKILNFNTIKEKLKFLKSTNKKKLLFIILFVSIAALVSVSLFLKSDKNELNKKIDITADNYSASIEQKLESMISGISEVTSIDAFVMVGSSVKYNYLMETTESEVVNSNGSTKTTSSKVVYEKQNGSSSPIIVSTSYPEIIGVMLVMNKVSSSTKLSIKNSVSIVLNIPEERISILQEK